MKKMREFFKSKEWIEFESLAGYELVLQFLKKILHCDRYGLNDDFCDGKRKKYKIPCYYASQGLCFFPVSILLQYGTLDLSKKSHREIFDYLVEKEVDPAVIPHKEGKKKESAWMPPNPSNIEEWEAFRDKTVKTIEEWNEKRKSLNLPGISNPEREAKTMTDHYFQRGWTWGKNKEKIKSWELVVIGWCSRSRRFEELQEKKFEKPERIPGEWEANLV